MAGAVVLLSGGLDSTFNLYKARTEFDEVLALTFLYGQRAAQKELAVATELCRELECEHRVVDLGFFSEFTKTALVNKVEKIPTDEVDIESSSSSEKTAEAVWVPNRNGIFLNVAAGFAEGLGYEVVVPGFNREEAETFPDNSSGYCQALDDSFSFSTACAVRVKCYSIESSKEDIVAQSVQLGVPLHRIWPCYFDGDELCGKCESCLRFSRALEKNQLSLQGLKGMAEI